MCLDLLFSPTSPTRLPELHDFLKKNQNLPSGVLLIAFQSFKTWISVSKIPFHKRGTVCILTKSQDCRKQSCEESCSSGSALVTLKGSGEEKTCTERVSQEAGLEQWPHCLTSAGANGCGCMSQGAGYYTHIVHGVHGNQIAK